MKKIIFEQIGNIILVILLIAALVQTVILSKIQTNEYLFNIKFGFLWLIFIVAALLFSFVRVFFSKHWKGYDLKKGEFSTDDEREQLISYQATISAYKSVVIALVVSLILFFWFSTVSNNILLMKITGIILFGSSIIVGFAHI